MWNKQTITSCHIELERLARLFVNNVQDETSISNMRLLMKSTLALLDSIKSQHANMRSDRLASKQSAKAGRWANYHILPKS